MSQHGLLLINKPSGPTSHDVVHRVRKILGQKDVGHAGTLDPLASGLMVLLLGEGTKISDYVLNGDKAYRVRVKFGVRTDSLDITGKILTHEDVLLDAEKIRAETLALTGEYLWPVPLFSAVKTGGKKLYEFAHNDQVPAEIPKKEMKFWDVEVREVGPSWVEASLHCSKGSYIRSWAAELGERMGVGGTVETLERTHSDPYTLIDAVDLAALEKPGQATAPWTVPLNRALPHWRTVTVKGKDERLIHNGQISHDLDRRLIPEQKEATLSRKTRGVKVLSGDTGHLLALLEVIPGAGLKIRRVFKMS